MQIDSLHHCFGAAKAPKRHKNADNKVNMHTHRVHIGLRSSPACCSKEPCNQATNRPGNPMPFPPTHNPMRVDYRPRHPRAKRSFTRGKSRAGDQQCPFRLLGRSLFCEYASDSPGTVERPISDLARRMFCQGAAKVSPFVSVKVGSPETDHQCPLDLHDDSTPPNVTIGCRGNCGAA